MSNVIRTALVVFGCTVGIVVSVRAGNQDSVFLGNQAAMSAGAVTAVSRGGEAAWYNPAGLGGSSLNSVDASASAFMLRIRNIPSILDTRLDADHSLNVGLSSVEILSIPSALVYTRRLTDNLWAGLAVFVPEQDRLRLRDRDDTSLTLANGVQVDYRQAVGLSGEETAYYIGPSVGWAVQEGLRLGASMFVVYQTYQQELQAWTDLQASADGVSARGFSLFDEEYSASRIGLQAVLGAQWDVGAWSMGATFRSPVLVLHESGEFSSLWQDATAGIVGETGSIIVDDAGKRFSETGFRLATPARLHLGIAWAFEGGWISLDADVAHPLDGDTDLGTEDRTWVVNGQMGTRFSLSESFAMGLGVFTDLSPLSRPSTGELGGQRTDYFGGTLGLEYRKRYAVQGEEDGDALTFASTFAFRYAVGLGEYIGIRSYPFDGGAIEGARLDITFHEVTLHIGSALYF